MNEQLQQRFSSQNERKNRGLNRTDQIPCHPPPPQTPPWQQELRQPQQQEQPHQQQLEQLHHHLHYGLARELRHNNTNFLGIRLYSNRPKNLADVVSGDVIATKSGEKSSSHVTHFKSRDTKRVRLRKSLVEVNQAIIA